MRIPPCRFLHYKSDMDIFITPEFSNLAKLSAIHLSGLLGGYKAIGTIQAPDLKQLVLHFGGPCEDQELPNPVLPVFITGILVSLTKLEIGSFVHFAQVDVLPQHLTSHIESAFKANLVFCAVSPSVTFSFFEYGIECCTIINLEDC